MTGTVTTDVAIVGGGLMGSWTAFYLRRRGLRVVLLDKGEIGAQSSGVNFGNLRLQGRFPGQLPLAIRSAEQWEQVADLIGESCEFEQTGHLYVAFEADQIDYLRKTMSLSRAGGLEIEWLDPPDLRARFPWLGESAMAASWSARDATANPRLATPAVARAAQALGAVVLPNSRVTSIRHGNAGFRLSVATGMTVESAFLVNTAGAWGAEIAEHFGETAPIFAGGPPQFVTEPLPYFIGPSVQAVNGRIIFRQVKRGNVIVAGYPRGASDMVQNRAPVDPAKTLATMRALVAAVPRLASASVIRVWSGIEGYMPDMLPVIGASAMAPGLLHAFGFCGHGFQLGPGVGLVLSELIADGASPTPLAPFSIARFQHEVVADEKFLREFDPRPAGHAPA